MATGKKSFVLYTDYKELFNELSNENAGLLIKHILSYVNDENPKAPNDFVKISFITIKMQLKRDLIKFEEVKEKRSLAGKISAEKKLISTKSTHVESVEHNSTKSTHVNKRQQALTKSTVNDNVNVNVIYNKEVKDFSPPLINEVYDYFQKNGFPQDLAKRAFGMYDCNNWFDTKGNKIKNWKMKMQSVWFKEENKKEQVIGYTPQLSN